MAENASDYSVEVRDNLILSQKMIIAFNEELIPLSYEFICFSCFGILINPMKCINCTAYYCENCIKKLPRLRLICYCWDSRKERFESCNPKDLFLTAYFNLNNFHSEKIKKILYKEIISEASKDIMRLFDSEKKKSNLKKRISVRKQGLEFNNFCDKSKMNFSYKFISMISKMINFNYAKGYKLKINEKNLNFQITHFLKTWNLQKLSLKNSIQIFENTFPFCQAIIKNRKVLKTLKCQIVWFNSRMYLNKGMTLFLHAISVCKGLKYLKLSSHFVQTPFFLLTKNIYDFLIFKNCLESLNLKGFVFLNKFDINSFGELNSLKCITFEQCSFEAQVFASLIEIILERKNISSMFFLQKNKFIDNWESNYDCYFKEILQRHFKLQQLSLNCTTEKKKLFKGSFSFLDFLTSSKNSNIKRLSMVLTVNCFIDFQSLLKDFYHFLLYSQIEELSIELNSIRESRTSDFPDFYLYLRNSKYLKKLTLKIDNGGDLSKLIQSLAFNSLIEELSLSGSYLRSCKNDIIKLIEINKSITALDLSNCDIVFEINLGEALLSNKTLKYLNLFNNSFDSKNAIIRLTKSNLKGVNVDGCNLEKSIIEEIYIHIPKILINKKKK